MFGPLQQMNSKDLMLLTLMKIRMGCSHEDLAYRFGLSKATVPRTLSTWIPLLALEFLIFIQPVTREQNKTCNPECFRPFGDNVVSILDCTEGQCERLSIAKAQAQTYSSYKNRNTWKKAIGIAPSGMINYISQAYGGSSSDRYIVETSGYLDTLNEGDIVMMDKGFNISDLLIVRKVKLEIPPFLKNKGKFTSTLTSKTALIARAGIHVERAIARVKYFRLLQTPLPLSMIDMLDHIFIIIEAITNLAPPLVNCRSHDNI
ncbi:uncharacterized protein LOC124809402 [Hydra vulgaris]|uniref:uncharacterized protein LOC124809402 n=1 Tax=Hydra vulgaris TaxID=6087 RepID=UPI001F5F44C1|nr:uncharacterized protein LOC124809402 [Hydra vulgaris]